MKIAYGGYVIWVHVFPDYEIYDVEKPGWDYFVATLNTLDEAKEWIDAHPNGDAVVAEAKAEKEERENQYWHDVLMDILCG